MTKTDRDTLRSLHGRKKWAHIAAYKAAVSVRILLLPSDMGVKPYFIASLTSSIEKSPSGPMSTVMPSLEACSFSLLAVSKKSTLGISS